MGKTGKTFSWGISAVLLLNVSAAWGQWAVTDPTAYGYYVQQIKQMTEALTTASDTLNSVNQVRAEMVGTYNRAAGLVGEMKDMEEQVRTGKGILTTRGTVLGYPKNEDGFIDISKVLDGAYGDVRSTTNRVLMDARHEVQQEALKRVVLDSEKLLEGVGDRINQVGTIAGQIDRTRNVKDATDLNNRILVEILRTLIEMLAIASKANQAQALFQYSGVTADTVAERQRVLNQQRSTLNSVLGKARADAKPILDQTPWR